jgi:hypothetical protein
MRTTLTSGHSVTIVRRDMEEDDWGMTLGCDCGYPESAHRGVFCPTEYGADDS